MPETIIARVVAVCDAVNRSGVGISSKMMVWCMDLMSSAWLCVGVQCDKSVVLSSFFLTWKASFIKKGPNINDVHGGFGPSCSIQLVLGKTNIRCLELKEKGCPKRTRTRATGPLLYAGPGPSFYMYDHFTQRRVGGLQRYFHVFIDSIGRLEVCKECRILQIIQFDVSVASVDSWIDFFCNRLGDLEMENGDLECKVVFCKHGVECGDVEYVHHPYSVLWSRETLPT